MPFESQHVPESQPTLNEVDETQEEEDDDEDEFDETQKEDDEEDRVDDTWVRDRTKNPSERKTEIMLKKIMVDKKEIGMNPIKPLTLE